MVLKGHELDYVPFGGQGGCPWFVWWFVVCLLSSRGGVTLLGGRPIPK